MREKSALERMLLVRKAVWLLVLAAFFVLVWKGTMAFWTVLETPNVRAYLDLKEKVQEKFGGTEVVVAVDRKFQDGHGILLKLVYEERKPWADDSQLEALRREVGEYAWRTYLPPAGVSLKQVTVVLSESSGSGCSSDPREVSRGIVEDPRGPGPDRPARGRKETQDVPRGE